MPRHSSWDSLYNAFLKEYGDKGREYFYRYMNKHGYDDSEPRTGQKSKLKNKEFLIEGEISPIVDKQFYGAFMPIVNFVEVKDVTGTNYYFEAFLTAPIKDLQGETLSENILPEWEKECQAPPHNLGWLFHESPYKSPENKDKPAFYKTLEAKITTLTDRMGTNHKGLWIKNIINKLHPRFNELWPLMKEGFLNAVSAEFWPIAEDIGNRVVNKAKYLASCLVMAPANDLATITSVYAKSFNGGKIEMSEKGINQSSPPDLPADDLEALLRARDQNMAHLVGAPIPDVILPPANLPLNIPPAVTTPSASTPASPTPKPPQPPADASAQKIDQILQSLTQLNERQNAFEQRLNVVAPALKDPEPEEIMRILKYLSGKEDIFKPKPNPQTKDVFSDVSDKGISPNKDWPDSCFAYLGLYHKTSNKSDRKIPYKSPSGEILWKNVSNALSRLAQEETDIPDEEKQRIIRKMQTLMKKHNPDYEPRNKGFSWEEVEELLDAEYEAGRKDLKPVVKAFIDNAVLPTGATSDLSDANVFDPDSIEGMLFRRDRILRTEPIGYP